jgi:hypothetical protein
MAGRAERAVEAREPNTKVNGEPFDDAMIEAVWQKAELEEGLEDSFRKDACGASMMRDKFGEQMLYAWEIDHIKPVSQGGTDEIANLQPLQWENNRRKGDNWPEWEGKVTM